MEQTIKTEGREFPLDMVANLICCALEGGSNYWYLMDLERSTEPEELWVHEDFDGFRHIQWPLSRGGRLFIGNLFGDEEQGFLDLESVKRGLDVMAAKYPRHFGDFASEGEDGGTGDVFLQCALFGDVVYG